MFALAFELQRAHGPLLWILIQREDLTLQTDNGSPSKDGDPGLGSLFPNPNGVLLALKFPQVEAESPEPRLQLPTDYRRQI